MGWGIATCRVDGEPLVSTLAFRKYEFYCLSCGGKYGFLDPKGQSETPELLERMNAVQAEFDEIAKDLLSQGGMHRNCATCVKDREPHELHATDEERERHVAAMAALERRTHQRASA